MAKYKKKIIRKKVVIKKPTKKPIKKPKKGIKVSGTLPPMVIPLPPKPKRKIPKDVTKRTPPKRKVPMRKSAVERERRVQFAKDNPLMPRKPTPRSRSALGVGILSPIGGPVSRLIGKGAKKLLQNKRVKSIAKKAVRPRLKRRKSKK